MVQRSPVLFSFPNGYISCNYGTVISPQVALVVTNPPVGDIRDAGLIPHFSILAWKIPWTEERVAKSQTQLKRFCMHSTMSKLGNWCWYSVYIQFFHFTTSVDLCNQYHIKTQNYSVTKRILYSHLLPFPWSLTPDKHHSALHLCNSGISRTLYKGNHTECSLLRVAFFTSDSS